jgi:hypothetical protein
MAKIQEAPRDDIIQQLSQLVDNKYIFRWVDYKTCCGYFDGIEDAIDVFNIPFKEQREFLRLAWDIRWKVRSETGRNLTFIFHNPDATKEFYSDIIKPV